MTKLKLDAFLAKYGTDGASLVIRSFVDTVEGVTPVKDEMYNLANELEAAFRELKE